MVGVGFGVRAGIGGLGRGWGLIWKELGQRKLDESLGLEFGLERVWVR